MVQNSAQKRAIRARMAETGENYTVARRRHLEEREQLAKPAVAESLERAGEEPQEAS